MDREPERQAEDEQGGSKQGGSTSQPKETLIPVYRAETETYDQPLFPSYGNNTEKVNKEPQEPKETSTPKDVQPTENENEELKITQAVSAGLPAPKTVPTGEPTWKLRSKAKYPRFENINARKQSFVGKYKQEGADDLAKNGYFMEDGNVQCFYCGSSPTADGKIVDITVKHTMQHRNCQYAKLIFKADYKTIHPNKNEIQTRSRAAQERPFPEPFEMPLLAGGAGKYQTPEEENRKRKMALKCEFCACTNMKDAVFCPCGHLVFCMKCAKNKHVCPKCKKKIERTIKAIRTDFSRVIHE